MVEYKIYTFHAQKPCCLKIGCRDTSLVVIIPTVLVCVLNDPTILTASFGRCLYVHVHVCYNLLWTSSVYIKFCALDSHSSSFCHLS
jgi:hypothetical protein